MTLAEQDQLGRELIDLNKRLNKLEATIEKLTASRAIHMDSVGTPKPDRYDWNREQIAFSNGSKTDVR